MAKRFVKAESTRYYLGRLWKICWVNCLNRKGRVIRVVKHYSRRDAVGSPWKWIRSITA